jgi:hypothetical protein
MLDAIEASCDGTPLALFVGKLEVYGFGEVGSHVTILVAAGTWHNSLFLHIYELRLAD